MILAFPRRYMGYHSGRMQAPTLLQRPKFQKLRDRWPALRQPVSDNQRRDTHVESHLALYSDGGSTPPISTRKGTRGSLFLWRWAESNRRPNKAPDGFLRVYPAFDCRRPAAGGRAIGPLASETWGAVEASAPASFLNDTPYTGGGRLESPAGYSSLRTWSARLS